MDKRPPASPPDLLFETPTHVDDIVRSSWWQQFEHYPLVPLVLRRERYENGESTGFHRHADFFALYAVRSGRGTHIVDGEAFPVARGDLYLLRSGAVHLYTHYQHLEIDAFYFTLAVFTPEEIEALRTLPSLWALLAPGEETTAQPRFHLTPGAWANVELQIEELRNEWSEDSLATPLLLRSGFFRFVVHIAREHWTAMRISGVPTKTPSTPIVEALRTLEADCARGWTVAELAAKAFLSPSRFSELFVREVGMPPGTYLKQLRLEQARTLLRETAMPLGRIALDCGFTDAAHFSRAFRGAYGTSPSQFRAKTRQNLTEPLRV